jgi:sulfite reductase alpha subunit-like flavoprotein
LRECALEVGQMLRDDNTHIYVCGLKGMEEGVLQALREIGERYQLDWDALWARLKREGRLHLETY